MHVHRRRDRDIGDGRVGAGQPGAGAEPRLENTGELVEIHVLRCEHRRVRLLTEQRLDAMLDQIHVGTRKPARRLPQQPTVDVRPGLEVARISSIVAHLVGGVLQDGVRLPQNEAVIFHGRQRGIRVDRQIRGRLLLRREVVGVSKFVGHAQEVEASQNLATVHRDRIGVNFHVSSLYIVVGVDADPASARLSHRQTIEFGAPAQPAPRKRIVL